MELLGQAELAQYLKVPSRTLWSWRHRGSFPDPVAELKCGPIWTKEQIDKWKRRNDQLKLKIPDYDQAKFMTAGEFAKAAGISRQRFSKLKNAAGLPKPSATRRNRKLYDRVEVKKWLRSKKNQALFEDS